MRSTLSAAVAAMTASSSRGLGPGGGDLCKLHADRCIADTKAHEKHDVFECFHLTGLRVKHACSCTSDGIGAHGDLANWLCGNEPISVASFLWEAHCSFKPCIAGVATA
jgi:hypothetical protein